MQPLLFNTIPLYFAMWGCAAVLAISLGMVKATRAGFPVGRSAAALVTCAAAILIGSKMFYLAEAHWFPEDDYVPIELRTALHGFRIPGGVLLLALLLPVACSTLRLPWCEFGDRIIPVAALALVFIRLGCFLNGCCFGKVSHLPWAVSFPRGSWPFWYHRMHGWVTGGESSLSVHPLQLYFVLAAVGIGAFVTWQESRPLRPGLLQMMFYTLFFGTTALLEPFRENPLTLNTWVVPVAAIVSFALFVRVTLRPSPNVSSLQLSLASVSNRRWERK